MKRTYAHREPGVGVKFTLARHLDHRHIPAISHRIGGISRTSRLVPAAQSGAVEQHARRPSIESHTTPDSVSYRLRSVRFVPRLSAFYGIVIYVYWKDHGPPHFHAEYGEHQALIVIDDGSVFAGSLPRRALRLVREWRGLHLDELRRAWERASRREDPGTIEPLP